MQSEYMKKKKKKKESNTTSVVKWWRRPLIYQKWLPSEMQVDRFSAPM